MKKQHVLIDFIKQSKIKNLTNVELFNELPFYMTATGFEPTTT